MYGGVAAKTIFGHNYFLSLARVRNYQLTS